MNSTRRQFLGRSALALAGAAALSPKSAIEASPLNQPLGFQCWEIIPYLTKDWTGTWQKMAGFGYNFVDLVTFPPRSPELGKLTPKEVRQAIEAAGLSVTNCHYSYDALTQHFDETMTAAHDLGLKTMICQPAPRRKTADDWKWMGDQLNIIGAKTQREGYLLGYHNHEVEFVPVDGQVPYDILMASTDPKLIKFQIDVGNLTFGGADAIAYLTKYADRCFSLHAKDFVKGKASVPVGAGTLDWHKIFALAAKAGIKSYVAEVGAYGLATLNGEPLEPSPIDVLESFRRSYIYLHDFKS
jgi:sugar phosphate isomerase/epimerase